MAKKKITLKLEEKSIEILENLSKKRYSDIDSLIDQIASKLAPKTATNEVIRSILSALAFYTENISSPKQLEEILSFIRNTLDSALINNDGDIVNDFPNTLLGARLYSDLHFTPSPPHDNSLPLRGSVPRKDSHPLK